MRTGRPKKERNDKHESCVSNYPDCGDLPLFFFGEGLSYTDFVYESFTLDRREMDRNGSVKASVTVRNGDMAGKEVVLLYLHDVAASAVRPVQELIGFEKIYLEASEFEFSVGFSDNMRFN